MSEKNILDEIVQKRKADIQKLGYNFGFEIPEERQRPVVPFVASKGTILEIKRASPSKGDIAPDLNAGKTAAVYEAAGTSAISVLTETNYFKGSLADLMEVCRTVKSVSVLRKDFLIDEEEVNVAYRCGADAVLLISRILDQEKMVSMARRCRELGITAFIELRKKEDLEKLRAVCEAVDSKFIVCGVNARDLRDFSIDLLTPAGMLECIREIVGKDARVVFESGIRTPQAAGFASSMGFTGMLLGEAAARNPLECSNLVKAFVETKVDANGSFWLRHGKRKELRDSGKKARPFVKVCGISNPEDGLLAAELGADFLGFIFCGASGRNVKKESVLETVKALEQKGLRKKLTLMAVIIDLESPEAKCGLELVKSGVLDAVQLHGMEAFVIEGKFDCSMPHYVAVNISGEGDLDKVHDLRLLGEPRILIDAKVGTMIGGTGTTIEDSLVEKVSQKTRLWLAGGVKADNVKEIIKKYNPELIDVCSGVEAAPGKKDPEKLRQLFRNLEECNG